MGNLIIKKVKYSGEKYYFDSPEFDYGINIIEGDNGSGKSTFSFFIEYALGGSIKPFEDSALGGKYTEILEDKNNYVELEVLINDLNYSFKRFINDNDIYISFNQEVERFSINRSKDNSLNIFSDWLLAKLNIPVFELNMGANTWKFNFNDLFRLLCYDQDTEPRKIYKSPANDNFVTDSSLIRKSTFETLLGISSIDFFKKLDELRNSQKLKDTSKNRLSDLLEMNPSIIPLDIDKTEKLVTELYEQLEKITNERNIYQKSNTKVDEKTEHLTTIQVELIDIDIKISRTKVNIDNYKNEINNIDKLLSQHNQEISEIRKTIFTHDKLNLFSMEICPFCMNKKDKKEGFCICGAEFKKDDYEKFVYNTSEYIGILKHREKSISTIQTGLESYNEELRKLEDDLKGDIERSTQLKEKLKSIIHSIEYSGNSQFVDSLNKKINDINREIIDNENVLAILRKKKSYEADLSMKDAELKRINAEYVALKFRFENDNKMTISAFNEIYNELMNKSSYKSENAMIDEDYMPYIDNGAYKNKSADVPKRLMYYFTCLSLGLKMKTVKHPHFLLIDTPEAVGIDDDNLKENLQLLDLALDLSKKNENDIIGHYQVILTTGENKYPDIYADKVKLRFNEKKKEYILKSK